MYRRMHLSLVIVVIGLLAAGPVVTPVPWALAQGEIPYFYTLDDETFTFVHPENWLTEEPDDNGRVVLMGVTDGLALEFYSPPALVSYGLDAIEEPQALVEEVLRRLRLDEGSACTAFTLEGRRAARCTYTDAEIEGLYVAVTFADGRLGMVDARTFTGGRVRSRLGIILGIVATFETAAAGASAASAQRLVHHEDSWQAAVGELQDLGLIPLGGSLVFLEDTAFFSGQGNFYTPLGRRRPHTNVIMAGEITYTAGSQREFESCFLGARIVVDGQGHVVQNVDVGVSNEDELYYVDYTGNDETSHFDNVTRTDIYDRPHHILLLLLGSRLTVYFDGMRVFDEAPVQARAGIYGIGLIGQGPGASCVGSNIWVYQVPYSAPGVCEVTVTRNVNKRSGPGTEHDVVGQLYPGNNLRVEGYLEGQDGYRWWILEDESWVREDVVSVVGECADVPPYDPSPVEQQPQQEVMIPQGTPMPAAVVVRR